MRMSTTFCEGEYPKFMSSEALSTFSSSDELYFLFFFFLDFLALMCLVARFFVLIFKI